MKFYTLVSRLRWSRDSFPRKVALVLFLSVQITLMLYIVFRLALGRPLDMGFVATVAAFNVGSWLLASLAMCLLLVPIERTAFALRAHMERQAVDDLPQHHTDVVGQLMRDAEYLAKRYKNDAVFIQTSADFDPVTKLYSRRAGRSRLAEDVARADRHQTLFHFAYFSLHGLGDYAATHGNARLDALVGHVASQLQRNIRQADWIARWSDNVFAVGFWSNSHINETVRRLHRLIEQSPFEIAGGVMVAPIAACGAATFMPGATLEDLLDLAGAALLNAQKAVDHKEAGRRVVVVGGIEVNSARRQRA